MANVQAPFGFQQFGREEGASPTAGLRTYPLDVEQNALGFGDPVDLINGIASASNPATPVLGIFYGCSYIESSTGRFIWNNFWPGIGSSVLDATGNPTPATAYVCDDPAQLFIAQAGTTLTITPDLIGQGIGFQRTLPDFRGISTTTLASNGNAPFRIVGLFSDFASPSGFVPSSTGMPNGLDNTSPGNIAVVAPNNFVRRNVVAAGS